MKRIIAFGLAAVFLLGATMVAIAESPTPAAKSKPAGQDGPRLGQALKNLPPDLIAALPDEIKQRIAQRRERGGGAKDFNLLHADGVGMKRDGTKVDVRIQKGLIQAVSSKSITLKSPDGYTQTYAIDEETKVLEKRKPASAADLKTGEMAKVTAVKKGDGYVAKLINCTGEPGPRLKKAFDAQ